MWRKHPTPGWYWHTGTKEVISEDAFNTLIYHEANALLALLEQQPALDRYAIAALIKLSDTAWDLINQPT